MPDIFAYENVFLVHIFAILKMSREIFFDAKFDGFWSFSQKVLQTQKLYISHLKALILSCYEPEEQGA